MAQPGRDRPEANGPGGDPTGGQRREPVKRPQPVGNGRYPRWIWILAGVVAVIAIIGYVIVGDRETVRTTDTLPQQIGPQTEPVPVTPPTPATPAPSPEPSTPVQPPVPVE
jgi:hypothetical protein